MKYKDLGTMLSKDEMKEVKGGRIILKDFGCITYCCVAYSAVDGICHGGIVPIAVETCNPLPFGCEPSRSSCTCLVP